MNVVIFGASGGTGRELVRQALRDGHVVTAFVRSVESFPIENPRLKVTGGDVTRPGEVERACAGQDIVLSALGAKGKVRVCAQGIQNILARMRARDVGRLVALSAFGAGESRNKGLYSRILWASLSDRMADMVVMEREILSSDVQWTIFRPPALTNGELTSTYRLGADLRVSLFSKVSRADVARAMLQVATTPRFAGCTLTIVG